jgi:hypothetical protein
MVLLCVYRVIYPRVAFSIPSGSLFLNNEPDGIENATHNTLQQKAEHRSGKCPGFSPDELRVAFSIPSGSLFLVNHPV